MTSITAQCNALTLGLFLTSCNGNFVPFKKSTETDLPEFFSIESLVFVAKLFQFGGNVLQQNLRNEYTQGVITSGVCLI